MCRAAEWIDRDLDSRDMTAIASVIRLGLLFALRLGIHLVVLTILFMGRFADRLRGTLLLRAAE